jgi:hypothetical protein
MKVECLNISAPPRSSSALAEAEIRINFDNNEQLGISGLRIFQNKGGALWVGWPTREQGGRFRQMLTSSRLLQHMVEDAVLGSFERWQDERAKAAAASQNAQNAGGAQ